MWLRVKQIAVLLLYLGITGCSGSGNGPAACTNSGIANVCLTTENGGYNGLGTHRFGRFSVASTCTASISAQLVSGSNTDPGMDVDPDLVVYRNGQPVAVADSAALNQELLSAVLTAGDYVVELYDYNHFNSDVPNTSCYTVGLQHNNFSSPKAALVVQSVAAKTLPAIISQAPPSSCSTVNEITVSGMATYDRVPNKFNHALNYSSITQEAVRGAVVELICAGAVYSSTVTDSNGAYVLNAPNGLSSFVRVKAQMLKADVPPLWNFRVEDNTSGNALYVMDGSAFSATSNITGYVLNADSGWDSVSGSYTTTRVAAPFAVLDSVYVAFHKILEVEPNAVFPALNINWSVNNVEVAGSVSAGFITTSHYDGNEIYLLGDADADTDEYDDHVIIHEWGHYFERQFSRADSIGGEHTLIDIIDIRVAFGEGWGNAFSAIASDDPVYSDSSGVAQAGGFGFNTESNLCSNPGWYSECSVQSILYDLYDAANDGVDNLNLGFAPIYNVLINEEKNTPALTSLFSFIKPLKDNNAASAAAIDTIVSGQNIDVITDIYGDSQLSNNPGTVDQLPVYFQF